MKYKLNFKSVLKHFGNLILFFVMMAVVIFITKNTGMEYDVRLFYYFIAIVTFLFMIIFFRYLHVSKSIVLIIFNDKVVISNKNEEIELSPKDIEELEVYAAGPEDSFSGQALPWDFFSYAVIKTKNSKSYKITSMIVDYKKLKSEISAKYSYHKKFLVIP